MRLLRNVFFITRLVQMFFRPKNAGQLVVALLGLCVGFTVVFGGVWFLILVFFG